MQRRILQSLSSNNQKLIVTEILMLLIMSPLHSLRKTKFFRFLLNTNLNKPKLFNIGFDHKVSLKPSTHASILFAKSKQEPKIRKLVIKICRELKRKHKDICFLDIGANIGIYTWEVHKICPEIKIFSFEPDPMNLELLGITVESNELNSIKIFQYALSNQSKETDFMQDDLTSATGTLSTETTPWIEKYLNGKSKKITIETKTMDDLIGNKSHPQLVKIDVEGHEYEVIQGGLNTIKKKPLLIFESFPPKRDKTLKILTELGYHFHDADTLSSVDKGTYNFFAWHQDGPIKKYRIREFINL